MKKINTVIIDDEKKNVKLLDHFINTYSPQIKIVGAANSKQDAINLINNLKPELIFLDIVLDGGTGFNVLEAINYSEFKVIFVTSYSEYVMKVFKYNVIDYILKPISIENLIMAVNKAYEEIHKRYFTTEKQVLNLSKSIKEPSPLNFIAIPSIDKIEFVKNEEIMYLKSEGRYTAFYLYDGRKIIATKNLGKFESIIDKTCFFRIHNSYIINLQYVEKISKVDGNYCEMSNNQSFPIAKRRQDALSKFLRIK